MILTTECLVTDIPEEKSSAPAGGMPGGMPSTGSAKGPKIEEVD